MFVISVKSGFAGAHFLRGYKGKCAHIHGHNWKIIVEISGNSLNELGMLMDFKDLKKIIESISDTLDHKMLNDLPYFSKKNPTAENIALFYAENIKKQNPNIVIEKITVYETDNYAATYIPD